MLACRVPHLVDVDVPDIGAARCICNNALQHATTTLRAAQPVLGQCSTAGGEDRQQRAGVR